MKVAVLSLIFVSSALCPATEGTLTQFMKKAEHSLTPSPSALTQIGEGVLLGLGMGVIFASTKEIADRIFVPKNQSKIFFYSPYPWVLLGVSALYHGSAFAESETALFRVDVTLETLEEKIELWHAHLFCLSDPHNTTPLTVKNSCALLATITSLIVKIKKNSTAHLTPQATVLKKELKQLTTLVQELLEPHDDTLLQAIEEKSLSIFGIRTKKYKHRTYKKTLLNTLLFQQRR